MWELAKRRCYHDTDAVYVWLRVYITRVLRVCYVYIMCIYYVYIIMCILHIYYVHIVCVYNYFYVTLCVDIMCIY